MSFEKRHAEFITYHSDRRSGERKGRLERGHAHGEKLFLQNIWWPMFGNFDHLHPEYEIPDLRGKAYFADFVYFIGYLRFIIEIKGFNSHIQDMDRIGFCGEMNRELYMQGIGYRIFSFAYDDVASRPDLCISLLRMNLSQFQPAQAPTSPALLIEKEVIRLALGLTRYLRPIDVVRHLDVNHRTAIKWLQSLVEKGWVRPVLRHPQSKVLEYEVIREKLNYFF
jgi:hypothetical protein